LPVVFELAFFLVDFFVVGAEDFFFLPPKILSQLSANFFVVPTRVTLMIILLC
jgi:hypothetical protein